MSESKHTRGPWETCGTWVCEENDPGHNIGICILEPRPETLANARLIAAAPDLLEALESLLSTDGSQLMESESKPWQQARAAIAKAVGNP